jgi:hypothetical protein
VTNATDDFQFQVSDLKDVTQTLTCSWSNTGDSANVNQASSLTGGSATLTIRGLVCWASLESCTSVLHAGRPRSSTGKAVWGQNARSDTDETL